MPDLINTARHIKKNARRAKSFSRKVQTRQSAASHASSLSPAVRPDALNSSTALVVRTATSLKTGVSTNTVSKKKLLKKARNAKYLKKSGLISSASELADVKGKEGRRKEAIAAAIATDIDDVLRYGNNNGDDQMDEDEVSSTQRKIRARNEANLRAKETAKALKQILESSTGISAQAALQGEMEIETSGTGTTLGRPRYVF